MVEAKFGPMKPGELCDIDQDDAVAYSARDADATIRIYPILWERIREMGLEGPFWRDMKMMPMVYAAAMGAVLLLTYLPWQPQTPWSMVCCTVLSLGAMLLAHWDDNPDDGDDDDSG